MKKGVVIGVSIAIIVVGIIGITSLDFQANNNSVEEEVIPVEEEVIPVEEEVIPVEEEGRQIIVELTESVGIKNS